jgi:hypothetical protein
MTRGIADNGKNVCKKRSLLPVILTPVDGMEMSAESDGEATGVTLPVPQVGQGPVLQ